MNKIYLLLLALPLVAGCSLKPTYSSKTAAESPMDLREAKKVIADKLTMVSLCGGGPKLTPNKIVYKPNAILIDFDYEQSGTPKKAKYKYNLRPEDEIQAGGLIGYYMAVTVINGANSSEGLCFYWDVEADAVAMGQALSAVQIHMNSKTPTDMNTDLEEFKKLVPEYLRKARGSLPEEARKYKVQGDSAFKEKNFDGALDLYGKALGVAPWWSTGYYNRALLFGEDGSYQEAIAEMKKYLALKPPAVEARKAQDKIYVWESKITNE
jgi:tetratricopeptide (TPR) repeat protein